MALFHIAKNIFQFLFIEFIKNESVFFVICEYRILNFSLGGFTDYETRYSKMV